MSVEGMCQGRHIVLCWKEGPLTKVQVEIAPLLSELKRGPQEIPKVQNHTHRVAL
jgi:hypothetical protein